MNIIAFIPARSGSKSVKDKNIKLLGGKHLLVYTVEQAFKAGISRVIVNSDSQAYLDIAAKHGAETMLRPAKLAKDDTPMFEVLKNEILKIDPKPEIVVLLSATVPFRKSVLIKSAISFFTNNLENYDSLMAVQRVPHEFNPAQVIVSTPQGLRMADGRQIQNRITRRQEYPNAYVTSQGLYIFKASNLEDVSFYGEKTMLMETNSSIDINTSDDFIQAEKYYQENYAKRNL